MLTAEQINKLSDRQAREALAAACVALHGERWKTAFARSIGMSPRQVNYWQEDGSCPPAWAIMLAQALVEIQKNQSVLNALRTAVEDLKIHDISA